MQCALLLGAAFNITYKPAGCYSSLYTLYIIPFNLLHTILKEEKYTLVGNKLLTHPPDMWESEPQRQNALNGKEGLLY